MIALSNIERNTSILVLGSDRNDLGCLSKYSVLIRQRLPPRERFVVVVPFPSASDFSAWPFGWPVARIPRVSERDNQGNSHASTFKNGGREHFSEIDFVAIPNLGSGPAVISS